MFKRKWKAIVFGLALLLALSVSPAFAASTTGTLTKATLSGDALYNGIVIPKDHTFSVDPNEGDAVTVPYLLSKSEGGYAPDLINIDVGRQLFIDDFLIESTTLSRKFYTAYQNPTNPIFYPETAWELTSSPSTACTSGGIWYDMDEQIYKMWYEAGFNNRMAYATSTDGIHWERPAINADGSNTLVRQQQTDSFSVWIDYDAKESERYKLMIRSPNDVSREIYSMPAVLYTSANGLTWAKRGETGNMLDRSTFFYNPFNEEWVFSIRGQQTVKWGTTSYRPRLRLYHADADFLKAGTWTDDEAILWIKPDSSDQKKTSVSNEIPELYNFDSIAYESVMLGFNQMFYGPQNNVTDSTGNPKSTEIQMSYSRDGFYYDRPSRQSLISADRREGAWNYGYLQTCTGGVIVYDDEIRIYYSAFSGDYEVNGTKLSGPYLGGAVGYATLRRDGFASMNGSGELTTKPLTVTKDVKYLFVNVNSSNGSFKAEILDKNGAVLEGYSAADCVAVSENTCKTRITWKNGKTLEQLQGKEFRIRFVMENGAFYSFWLSPDEIGTSGGEMAAGYAGEDERVDQSNTDVTDAPTTDSSTDSTSTTEEEKDGCFSVASGSATVLLSMLGCGILLRKKKRKKDGAK